MKTEHTPLPWHIGTSVKGDLSPGTLVILGKDEHKQAGTKRMANVICAVAPPYFTTDIDRANAEYIVEACNEYEDLDVLYRELCQDYYKAKISRDNWKKCAKAQQKDIQKQAEDLNRLKQLWPTIHKAIRSDIMLAEAAEEINEMSKMLKT